MKRCSVRQKKNIVQLREFQLFIVVYLPVVQRGVKLVSPPKVGDNIIPLYIYHSAELAKFGSYTVGRPDSAALCKLDGTIRLLFNLDSRCLPA